MVHFDTVFCGFSMEVVNCSKDEVCNFFFNDFSKICQSDHLLRLLTGAKFCVQGCVRRKMSNQPIPKFHSFTVSQHPFPPVSPPKVQVFRPKVLSKELAGWLFSLKVWRFSAPNKPGEESSKVRGKTGQPARLGSVGL